MNIPSDTGLGKAIQLLEARPRDRAFRVERQVLEQLCQEAVWLAEDNARHSIKSKPPATALAKPPRLSILRWIRSACTRSKT